MALMNSSDISPGVTAGVVGFSLFFVLCIAVGPYLWSCFRQTTKEASLDNFLSSRKSQSWVSIGLSLYATAVGTWTLTAPAENAVIYGWWGALGYIIAIGGSWSTFLITGPKLRRYMHSKGYTSLAFTENRFGRWVRVVSSLNSIVYMALVMITELTAMSGCITALSPGTKGFVVIIAVTAVVGLFTAVGGMPSTFVGDKICAVLTVVLMIVAYTAVFVKIGPEVDRESWRAANTWPEKGIPTGLVLIFSCFLVEQANQSTWQRVFAAKTLADSQKGFIFGMALLTPSMVLFTFGGFLGLAASIAGVVSIEDAKFATMFVMLAKLPKFLAGLVLLLVMVLVSSTMWTMQAGMAALVADELSFLSWSVRWARVIAALVLVPIGVIAAYNPPSVIQLLMMANIITVCVVPVTQLGFWPFVTSTGVLLGILCAFLSVLTYGWIHLKTFKGGFVWFKFPDGADWHCLGTFLIAVGVSAAVALAVSNVQFKLNPKVYEKQVKILEDAREEASDALITQEIATYGGD